MGRRQFLDNVEGVGWGMTENEGRNNFIKKVENARCLAITKLKKYKLRIGLNITTYVSDSGIAVLIGDGRAKFGVGERDSFM